MKNYRATGTSLGNGAFSDVYLFESIQTQRRYAVKLIFKEDLDAEIFVSVNEEVRILALLDHPNIVKYNECY